MGMIKEIFSGNKKGSCCDVKIEEVKADSGCCGGDSGCCSDKTGGSADAGK